MGYIGDFAQPNVFSRFHRMGEENYVQIGAQKRLGKDRDRSAEFDSIQSIRYTREAFRWQKLPAALVHGLQVEALTRASDNPTFGWSSNPYRDVAGSITRLGRGIGAKSQFAINRLIC
jgi:hypothetical protein